MTTSWKNLNSKLFTERSDRWYNLATKRFVKNQPKNTDICWSLRKVRVLGTESQVQSFWDLNSKQLRKICSGKTCSDELFQPFRDIAFISDDAASRSAQLLTGPSSQFIKPPRSIDVESLTNDQLTSLTHLHFGGLFLKARVMNVIDGDTLTVAVFFPLVELSQARSVDSTRKSKDVKFCAYPLKEKKQTGFFTVVSIRTYGYDAVEKDEPAGQLAKQLFQEKLESLNNVVWCQFIDPQIHKDKYGRHLAVLYEDPQKQKMLNDYLLRKEQEVKTTLVHPYLGGTKEGF